MEKSLKRQLKALHAELLDMRSQIVKGAKERLAQYKSCYRKGRYSKSACNLAAYLAFRQQDIRPLQHQLAQLGLSSLAHGESHIIATIDRVLDLLAQMIPARTPGKKQSCPVTDFSEGPQILEKHTDQLFGKPPDKRCTRIMVTMPAEAAHDMKLVRSLMKQGMDCARINCAHDDVSVWSGIIENVRRAEEKSGRHCRVLMDLAGHKIRTTEVQLGAPVHHLKVKRDDYGRIISSASLLLYDESSKDVLEEGENNAPGFALPTTLHGKLATGDRLDFTDGRGKDRSIAIDKKDENGYWLAQCHQSSYLVAGTTISWHRAEADGGYQFQGEFSLGAFPGQPLAIRLYPGEPLLLSRNTLPGMPARYDHEGRLLAPARIGCSVPAIIDDLAVGDPVWLDDGKIGLQVEAISEAGALLRVIHADPAGVRIRGDKGINCPNTRYSLPALSEKDYADLDFICRNADMVGYSFVETRDDIELLAKELKKRKAGELPIVAKIETERAVNNLPELILSAIGRRLFGVMIARGDLSVELGSVRLAEIQEEILWLCEAAHVPVVWATQVLESMAKRGVRSRAEFTDAAVGERAECVMLNKGPFIVEAVHALDSVLVTMEKHQRKKMPHMSALDW